MQRITITQGLDLPIWGEPDQVIDQGRPVTRVALVGPNYPGMKPTMEVAVGDSVKTGQVLFTDKKTPGVCFTSPGCGKVVEVNRGAKRAFQSVVVQLSGEEEETFGSFSAAELESVSAEEIVSNLVRSGLWTTLRTRPFNRIPSPETLPRSVFITAIDTNPLAIDPAPVLADRRDDFIAGVKVLSKLARHKTFLCIAPDAAVPGEDLPGIETVEFEGPHPAGLVGTHMHFLDPVGPGRTSWSIGYQDVAAIGHLFWTGRLDTERVVSLAGPGVKSPRAIRTRLGASLDELTDGELDEKDETRIVSGSVLCGSKAEGPLAYLGRYDNQVVALKEGNKRYFFGWVMPGFRTYSVKRVFAGACLPDAAFAMDTNTHGRKRPVFPTGAYERVMPLDIEPTFLLRALAIHDVEQSESLGALELAEEDLALCTYVCPGKENYGRMLRETLTIIEKEG